MNGRRSVLGLFTLAVIGVSAGCGGASAARPTPSPRHPIAVTWSDQNRTFAVSVGQQIKVALAGQSCTPTSVPVASPNGILRVEAVGTVRGNSWARFRAVGSGHAVITATHGDSCAATDTSIRTDHFRLNITVAGAG